MPRRRQHALVELVASSGRPAYVLDADRHLIYCNRALCAWLQINEAQIVGRRCAYVTTARRGHPDDQQIADGLCPPPHVFLGNADRSLLTISSGRQIRQRWASFLPLDASEDGRAPVLAIVHESDLSDAEAKIAASGEAAAAQLHRRLLELRRQIASQHQMDLLVGESHVMRRVREQVRAAVDSRVHVLVTGPPGSGREQIARSIHHGRCQSEAALIPLACPLMDAELLQSTVMAIKRQSDGDERDNDATLLLLQVDELPTDAQQELSGLYSLPGFELPTLCTSLHRLIRLADEDAFSRDLAFRLETLVIDIPALGDRREDIPLLAQCFLEQENRESSLQREGFSTDAMDQLVSHPWPGNVKELAEVVEQSCDQAVGPVIQVGDLPKRLRQSVDAQTYQKRECETIQLDQYLERVEGELIRRAMQQAKGNKTRAAQLLGINRARLHRRLEGQDNGQEE